jgi:hypothetical protein
MLYANIVSALKILALLQELRPGLPVVTRTLDDNDIDRLRETGAAQVVAGDSGGQPDACDPGVDVARPATRSLFQGSRI